MPYKVTPEKVVGRMKILIYGPQGVGKTYLAATAQDHPAMRDVLFLNVEGGLMTIAHRGDIMAEDTPHQGLEDTEDRQQRFRIRPEPRHLVLTRH